MKDTVSVERLNLTTETHFHQEKHVSSDDVLFQ